MERCPGDDRFGPVLDAGKLACYGFDFTLVFEESIFSIVPCVILIPLAAARLRRLWSRPVETYRLHKPWESSALANWPLVLGLKLVSCCCPWPSREGS